MVEISKLEQSVSEEENNCLVLENRDDIILKMVKRTTYAVICIAIGVGTYRLIDYFSN